LDEKVSLENEGVEHGTEEYGAKNRKINRLQSSLSVVFEFGDDEENEKKIKGMNNEFFFLEHEVNIC
jgi:hypothetical protein